MKIIVFTFCLVIAANVLAQQPNTHTKIDSIVANNENSIETSFQKIEPYTTKTTHSKNPKYISSIYRLTANKSPVEITFTTYSIGDTALNISYYFNNDQLIKVNARFFSWDNRKFEDTFYYNNDIRINSDVEVNGAYPPNYYVERANDLIKKLKKKPIKFPY